MYINKQTCGFNAKYVNFLHKNGNGTLEQLCEPGRVLIKYPIIDNK